MSEQTQAILTVADALRGTPERVSVAVEKLPAAAGFYAWWGKQGCIPGVPSRPHPSAVSCDILYVGIAPSGPGSKSTIRSRVIRNHLRGNIAASTLRLTLASLLHAELQLAPRKATKKVVLRQVENAKLSAWQQSNLLITWHAVANPWELEAGVIAELRPPLNLDDNAEDSFFAELKKLRQAFRASAI